MKTIRTEENELRVDVSYPDDDAMDRIHRVMAEKGALHGIVELAYECIEDEEVTREEVHRLPLKELSAIVDAAIADYYGERQDEQHTNDAH